MQDSNHILRTGFDTFPFLLIWYSRFLFWVCQCNTKICKPSILHTNYHTSITYTHIYIVFSRDYLFSGSLPFNSGQVSIQKGLSPAQAAIRRDRHTASQCIGSGILQQTVLMDWQPSPKVAATTTTTTRTTTSATATTTAKTQGRKSQNITDSKAYINASWPLVDDLPRNSNIPSQTCLKHPIAQVHTLRHRENSENRR